MAFAHSGLSTNCRIGNLIPNASLLKGIFNIPNQHQESGPQLVLFLLPASRQKNSSGTDIQLPVKTLVKKKNQKTALFLKVNKAAFAYYHIIVIHSILRFVCSFRILLVGFFFFFLVVALIVEENSDIPIQHVGSVGKYLD